ncbi:hypothetical protein, partial [Winogradskyella poriferorum]|uniref:hypothetical protein n=1 Tax=Winogradskyella poriferorum TaxID=307627 RepID=UPI003D64E836
ETISFKFNLIKFNHQLIFLTIISLIGKSYINNRLNRWPSLIKIKNLSDLFIHHSPAVELY